MALVTLRGLPALLEPAHAGTASIGTELPLLSVPPFALLLLTIAIPPLVHGLFWEKNSNKAILAAVRSLPVLIYLGGFCGPRDVLCRRRRSSSKSPSSCSSPRCSPAVLRRGRPLASQRQVRILEPAPFRLVFVFEVAELTLLAVRAAGVVSPHS